ncbi:7131_t:CDS:2 [Entrophospora sp. SA101]|nr:1046_t:CDS:2 [Entrophospora sp. SA101]CAJ0650745.1 7131_t:CDS:2 [Entrophospora sp. SA101]CAJ0911836.1 11145_t:CDS:2 [Entrophospora sp. SA101]
MSTASNVLSIVQTFLLKSPENISVEEKKKYTIFKNGQDALAALFHAIMISFEFRLIGFGEDDNLNVNYDIDNEGNIITLPDVWNAQGPNFYAFRYKHHQSSLTFLIKSMKMSNKFLVHGMAIEDNKTVTFETATEDYVYPSIFPYTLEKAESQPLLNVYISESRINDLINQYKTKIIDKLIPNLYNGKGGTTTTPIVSSTQPNTNDPLRIPTRQPLLVGPSIFGDPYGIPSRGGGMLVGPDHPMFGQRVPSRGDEIFGGPQNLPRGSVPPGARFDPIGPLGPQPLPRPGQPRGRGGNFFSGDPDNDELPPPILQNLVTGEVNQAVLEAATNVFMNRDSELKAHINFVEETMWGESKLPI